MNILNISDNIIRYRHEKKITQEELADFIGVTKASVSKWENKQNGAYNICSYVRKLVYLRVSERNSHYRADKGTFKMEGSSGKKYCPYTFMDDLLLAVLLYNLWL